VPLTAAGPLLACHGVGIGIASLCVVTFNIVSVSYRQALCPDHLLGRVNATMRFLIWGMVPLGGLAGGTLGGAIGLRPTLWVSAVGGVLATGWLLASPLRYPRAPQPMGTVAG
jgi:hypothetical protein